MGTRDFERGDDIISVARFWKFNRRLWDVDTPGAKKVLFITVINEQHFSYTYLSQDFGYCEILKANFQLKSL